MRLILSETRHLGLQIECKNEAVVIRIEKYMIFLKLALKTVIGVTGKTEVLDILLAHHSHQPPNLMDQLSLNTKIGSSFMILFDHLSTLIKCHSIHILFTTTI